MTNDAWSRVDAYLADALALNDPALAAALEASAAAELPAIGVSPPQGKLLHLLARMCGARRILEIGTLGGYSTIWLARALPADGILITLEAEPRHAEVASANLARAGLASRVQIRVGPALEALPLLASEDHASFDFVFIDADKPSTPEYFRWALALARPGGVVVIDNVVRQGALAGGSNDDREVLAMRRLVEQLAAEPGVSGTVIQTVGTKGYDGFAIAIVGAGE